MKIKNNKTHKKTQWANQRVWEATKLNAETRDPPARISEITKSNLHGMTITLAL